MRQPHHEELAGTTAASPPARSVTRAYGPIDGCQLCDQRALEPVLFLGYLPPVNRLIPIGSLLEQEMWFPAELRYCPTCHLVQLGFAVDPSILFPPEYPYTSGTTRILRENFADLYRQIQKRFSLGPDDLVVDIGSNDGTLLRNFQEGGHRVLGIEPSLTAQLAESRGIPTQMTFFNRAAVERAKREFGSPRLVTATNVFAHIHNVHSVIDDIEALVGPEGIFVSESHYLRDLVETLQYDTIYHEHLRYYSLTSLRTLLQQHGLQVFSVERIPTHGGSIRVYASKSSAYPVDATVDQLLQEEATLGLANGAWINEFRQRVVESKLALYDTLIRLKRAGARVYGIGAPSRASTLITYLGLDDGILECVLEVSGSKKLNKYMPGTTIPVVDEARLYADQPSCVLLLSWHLASELCVALKRRGYRGDFLVPLPSPRLIPNSQVISE